ncbi:MAG TPA: protein-disulfide reductase DsbD domain-containing protein [Tepidisphaeraceae bacterium]|jgi:DsbC/DsbD-like thiol-disulfide interchange protein|nr:protein-disulfide reductase DsbD domain-containing protein [Tepidisphaeraceae bacterium]
MSIRGSLLAVGFFCCVLTAQAWAQPPQHVRAEVLADVSSVQAGKPFWLGVRLSVDPGWHVYWKNPGDAGLPTQVKFTVPDGFTVGPLQYPTPQRIDQAGNILALAYEDSVLLLAKVTPPDHLPADFHGEFQAAISWLVCSQVCLPGKATESLTLGASESAQPANRELFDQWISQLPVDANESADVADVHSNADNKGDCSIEIAWRSGTPDSVEFLPGTLDDYTIGNTVVKSSHHTTVISFTVQPLAGMSPPPTTLEAVVGYASKDGKRRGAKISVALPSWSANNR